MWFINFLNSISTSKYINIYTIFFISMGILLITLRINTHYDIVAILLLIASSLSMFCFSTLGFLQNKHRKWNLHAYIITIAIITISYMVLLNNNINWLNIDSDDMQFFLVFIEYFNFPNLKPPYSDYVLNIIFENKIHPVYFEFMVKHYRWFYRHCLWFISDLNRCSVLNKYWVTLIIYGRQINDLSDSYLNLFILLVSI